jgi:hypothetical protein
MPVPRANLLPLPGTGDALLRPIPAKRPLSQPRQNRGCRFALVVHHDDDVREYAYDDRQILDAAAGGGWTVLSMRDDFARVWPAGLADGAR